MIVNLNSHHFSIVAPDFGYTGGSGLYLRASMMNHSCDYNSRFLSSFMSSEKILFATRDIAKDEQICISYIEDPSAVSAQERKLELSRWGFECACGPCKNNNWAIVDKVVEEEHYSTMDSVRKEIVKKSTIK